MKVSPFTPKGSQSQTTILYNVVIGLNPEVIYKFDQLEAMTGFKKDRIQMLMAGVNKKLLKGHNIMMTNVRGVGYKLATPQEQISHAEKRTKKARRQHRTAILELENIDVSKMTPEERKFTREMIGVNQMALRATRSVVRKAYEASEKARKESEKASVSNQEALNTIDSLQSQLDALKKRIR